MSQATANMGVATSSKTAHRASYVMQGIVTPFLAFDSLMKFIPQKEAIEGSAALVPFRAPKEG